MFLAANILAQDVTCDAVKHLYQSNQCCGPDAPTAISDTCKHVNFEKISAHDISIPVESNPFATHAKPAGKYAVDSFNLKKFYTVPSHVPVKRSDCQGLTGYHNANYADPDASCKDVLAAYERDQGKSVMTFRESIIEDFANGKVETGAYAPYYNKTTGLPSGFGPDWKSLYLLRGRGNGNEVAQGRSPDCGNTELGFGKSLDGSYRDAADGWWIDPRPGPDDIYSGDYLYDNDTKELIQPPALMTLRVYVPSKRTDLDSTFPMFDTSSDEALKRFYIEQRSDAFETTDALDSFALDVADDSSLIASLQNAQEAGTLNSEFFGNLLNEEELDEIKTSHGESPSNSWVARVSMLKAVRSVLERRIKEGVGEVAFDHFITKFKTTSTFESMKKLSTYTKFHDDSYVMDPVTKIWGTTYDMNNIALDANINEIDITTYANKGNKLPIVVTTRQNELCPEVAAQGMICILMDGHYFYSNTDPALGPDHGRLANVRAGRYPSFGIFDDSRNTLYVGATKYGYTPGSYGQLQIHNFYANPQPLKCRAFKDDGLESNQYGTGVGSLDYSINLLAGLEKMISASSVGPFIDTNFAAMEGRSGNGQWVNAAMMKRSSVKDNYEYASQLSFDWRAGWIQDGTFDFDTTRNYVEEYEFGVKDGYPTPTGKQINGLVGHSYIPHPEGFTFPVIITKAFNDAFGYHWSSGVAVTDDWSLKTLFAKMEKSQARPTTSWQYPTRGTSSPKEILGESFLNLYGSEHGWSQYAGEAGNFPDGASHPNAAFGLDISARMTYSDVQTKAKDWPSATQFSTGSAQFMEMSVEATKLENVLKRNRGIVAFFKRHLMNDWSVSQEQIEKMLPGQTFRAPFQAQLADSLIINPIAYNSITLPENVNLFNRVETNLFDVTPHMTVKSFDLSAMQITNLPYTFDAGTQASSVVNSIHMMSNLATVNIGECLTTFNSLVTSSDLFGAVEPADNFTSKSLTLPGPIQGSESLTVSSTFGCKAYDTVSCGATDIWHILPGGILQVAPGLDDKETAYMLLTMPQFSGVASFRVTLAASTETAWDFGRVYKNILPADLPFTDPQIAREEQDVQWYEGSSVSGNDVRTVNVGVTGGDTVLLVYQKDWSVSEYDDIVTFSNMMLTLDTPAVTTCTELPAIYLVDSSGAKVHEVQYTVDSSCIPSAPSGAADSYGDDCEGYAANPRWCPDANIYATSNFNALTHCCVCGGGQTVSAVKIDDTIVDSSVLSSITPVLRMMMVNNTLSVDLLTSIQTTPIPSTSETPFANFLSSKLPPPVSTTASRRTPKRMEKNKLKMRSPYE